MYVIVNKQVKFLISQYIGTCKSAYTNGYALNWVLTIGSEDSALDYAFMFSVIESSNMNKLSPGCYIKELVSRLTSKASSNVDKVALLPCFIQK